MASFIAVAAESYDGFTIYNVDDPSAPVEVGTISDFSHFNDAQGIAKLEDTIVVGSSISGRVAFADISDLANPAAIDGVLGQPIESNLVIPHPDGQHAIVVFMASEDEIRSYEIDLEGEEITLVSTFEGDVEGGLNSPRQAVISESGNYLYVAVAGDDTIEVFDISDPTSLSRSGTFAVTGLDSPQGITRIGDHLYVADTNNDRLVVVDVSTEDSPALTPVGAVISAASMPSPRRLEPSPTGTHIYVWSKAGSSDDPVFAVVDVTTPASPSVEGALTLVSTGFNVYLHHFAVGADGTVYIPQGRDETLVLVDPTTDPSNPAIVGTISDASKLDRANSVFAWGDQPAPDTPSIVDVEEGIFGAGVTGSEYAHSETPFSAHFSTQVEVDEAGGDFSDPVASATEEGFLSANVTGLDPDVDYIARLRYRSVAGLWSDWSATVAFTTEIAVQPATPSIFVVAVEHDSVVLESSAYSHPGDVDFGELEFEVDEAGGDFSDPVSAFSSVDPLSWQGTLSGLSPETSYVARAKHTSIEEVGSDWSGSVAFATAAEPGAERPNKPTVSVVAGSVTALVACFESSSYSSPVGSPHVLTEWAILTSPSRPDSFWWRHSSASDLVDWCASSDFQHLQPHYTHGVVVRYLDDAGRWSSWSDPVAFTTLRLLRPPRFVSPGHAYGADCDEVVQITWDADAYPAGTTYNVEFSDDFGDTFTRVATASATPSYNFDATGREARFGYVVRVMAVTPDDGDSEWGYFSLSVLCGQGVLKEAPFDADEWTERWDVHRALWSVTSSDVSVSTPGTTLDFPRHSGVFPQRWMDWSLLTNEDFGQPIDCDMEGSFWQEGLGAATFHHRLLQQRDHRIGIGIMGDGERVPYDTDPPRDPLDPDGSYFNAYQGLRGVFGYVRWDSPWPYGELPPHGYVGGVPIADWPNDNGGCATPSKGKLLGWGRATLGLVVLVGDSAPFVLTEEPLGSAPVTHEECTGVPKYLIRLSVRTVHVRSTGNRDLRIRVGLGHDWQGNKRWQINRLVEDVPITCGYPGVIAQRVGSAGFGMATARWDRVLVVPYDYADCEEQQEIEVTPTSPRAELCPEGGEPITNPPLYIGTKGAPDESAGLLDPGRILLYSRWHKDDEADIPCRMTTREVAPRTTRGDSLFRNVYLVVSGQSSAFVIVTPIVDGELKQACARSFVVDWDPEDPTPPFLRRYELALYEPVYDAESVEVGRRGLRGTHFKLKVEVLRTWECGQLYLDGIELEWDEATERHNKVVEVEEPWVKSDPPDVGHLLFGTYLEDDSAGTPQAGRIVEYGGNPEGESEFFQTDDGAPIARRIRSREVAPFGIRGDAIFTAFYLAFLRYNTEPVTVSVTPIVDETVHPAIDITLGTVGAPMLDVREVPLAQDVLGSDGTTVVGRRALRGTWIRLELNMEELPAGVVYMESRGLEVAPATEDQEPIANA